MRKNLKIFAIALLTLGLIATGCTKKKESLVSKATKDQILLLGNGAEPKDLDPHVITGVPENHIMLALFEGLVNADPKDLHPIPGMAESWEISQNGTVFTFKIRKNAKWSNGDAFTANDFVYSWKRILTPKMASEYAYMLFVVKNAEKFNKGTLKDFSKVGAKALDDHTFQVTLGSTTPYFLNLLQHYSTWPVNKKTIEKFGEMDEIGTKWTRPGNLVSNGPFVLKKWELNKIIAVEKNNLYWDKESVRLKEIHYFPIESYQTEERAFRAGQLHVTNEVPIPKIATYRKKKSSEMVIAPYLGTYYYRFNVTKKPFNDVRVRRAFSMSINRQLLVDKVTKAGQLAAYSFVPPDTGGFTSRIKISFDIEAAKKLLAEAGYPGGKGLQGAEILYNTSEGHKTIAEAIQQMWKKNLGVQVTLTNQDWKVYLSSQKSLNYSMSRAGWIGDYPDANTFMDMFVTDGGNNQTGWSNKEYDRLIALAARTQDLDERLEVFHKAEKILIDESPILPIYTYVKKSLRSSDVKGYYSNILDHHPYKFVWLSGGKGEVDITVGQQ